MLMQTLQTCFDTSTFTYTIFFLIKQNHTSIIIYDEGIPNFYDYFSQLQCVLFVYMLFFYERQNILIV